MEPTIPGPRTVDEDSSLVFSGNALSVFDVDADDGTGLRVNLTVGKGVITVGSSTASVTNDGSGAVTIDGTVAQQALGVGEAGAEGDVEAPRDVEDPDDPLLPISGRVRNPSSFLSSLRNSGIRVLGHS